MKGDAQWRKQRPLVTGVLAYFPDALLEVAYASWVGNEQHNPGTPLHWDRAKSTDDADALGRHLLQAGEVDTDGVRHAAKVAWRALACLQKELEAAHAVPVRAQPRRPDPLVASEQWDAFERYRADLARDAADRHRSACDQGDGASGADASRPAD